MKKTMLFFMFLCLIVLALNLEYNIKEKEDILKIINKSDISLDDIRKIVKYIKR